MYFFSVWAESVVSPTVAHTGASWAFLGWSCQYVTLRVTWAAFDAAKLCSHVLFNFWFLVLSLRCRELNGGHRHFPKLYRNTSHSWHSAELCHLSDSFFPLSLIDTTMLNHIVNLMVRWHGRHTSQRHSLTARVSFLHYGSNCRGRTYRFHTESKSAATFGTLWWIRATMSVLLLDVVFVRLSYLSITAGLAILK